MNRDLDRIDDIAETVRLIQKFTLRKNLYELNELEQAGIIHFLQIIGEASRALSQGFKDKYNQIDWAEIIAFRNIIVHEYLHVDFDIVSKVIERDIPVLKEKIEDLQRLVNR